MTPVEAEPGFWGVGFLLSRVMVKVMNDKKFCEALKTGGFVIVIFQSFSAV